MFRSPAGNPQSITLLGIVPNKSVLTFQAGSGGGRTTYMPPIQGAAGVRFRFKPSAAVFRPTPVAKPMLVPRAKAKATARVKRPK